MPEGTKNPVSGGERLFRLKNTVKHYDWGSPVLIPRLLGEDNPEGLPWAELWMGVHPEGPSEVLRGEEVLPLSHLIGGDPRRYLGEAAAENFGTLPFLFKLLAAEKPLSIQAHPNKRQAEEGWERENARSVPPDSPLRNYRDRNHKPEILAAIDPFTAMCGFREPGEIAGILERFFSPLSPEETILRECAASLTGELRKGGLRGFLGGLFALPPGAAGALSAHALKYRERLAAGFPEYAGEWELCASFAASRPGDGAVIAPLYLNLINLRPAEAIFLPPGVLHAYVRGFGAELMASSDNVLRGGLSSKHIDTGELFNILNFSPFKPEILRPPLPAPACFKFPAPCREFALFLMNGSGGETLFPGTGPVILILIAGEALISTGGGGESLLLRPGEAVFSTVPRGGELRLRGNYTLYAAGLGAG